VKRIRLTTGEIALVDDADYSRVARYSWFVARRGRALIYAVTQLPNGTWVYMHRFVLRLRKGSRGVVDHLNANGLDNRRRNLRRCSVRQNLLGMGLRTHSSRFKGVYWAKPQRAQWRGSWVAQIGLHRKVISLGHFEREEDAARAYNRAARRHYGRFARLNKVPL